MAVVTNIFLTSAGSGGKLFVDHLHKRAVNALYGNAILYEQGDKKPLPGGSGTTMKIPKYVGGDNISTLTEGAILEPTSAAMSSYSGTVAGYGEVRAYSDFIMAVNEIPQYISDEINDMVMYARKKLDKLAVAQLSASGNTATYVKPDGATARTSVINTTVLKQRALFDANSTLAANNANPYPDGTFHGVFHPNQIHDLFVAVAGSGGNTGMVGGALEQTDKYAAKLERASLGTLGNIKVFQSTWGTEALGSAEAYYSSGVATGTGFLAFIMAPGAFASVDLATSRLKTYWKPATTGGNYDAIEQVHKAGVKFYACCVAMDTANRLCRTSSGDGTF